MAGATVSFQMNSSTVTFGTITIGPVSVTGTITPLVQGPNLASGFNSITVPASASGFVFTPPSTNTQTLQLKGVTGDTGVSMPKTTSFFYLFDTGNVPATIGITAGGTVNNCEIIFF